MEDELIETTRFRNIKYSEEELKDVYDFVYNYIKNHPDKEIITYFESVICHKIDRLCYCIPNFILSVDIFKLVKDTFVKIIELKEDKTIKERISKIVNEIYLRFKYLIEWCILYYEETYQ